MTGPFETFDPRFATYVLHNAPLERLVDGCRWTEGPVWFGDAGALLFSDIPNNRILRWIEGAGVSVFRQPSDFANGNTRDREGRLITCSHGRRAVLRTELSGSQQAVSLAELAPGCYLVELETPAGRVGQRLIKQ